MQTEDIVFGAGDPLRFGWWLLIKLPAGVKGGSVEDVAVSELLFSSPGSVLAPVLVSEVLSADEPFELASPLVFWLAVDTAPSGVGFLWTYK